MDEAARKKTASAIVDSMDEGEEPTVEVGPDAGLVAAMDSFLAAVEAKDSTAMAEAWLDACAFK